MERTQEGTMKKPCGRRRIPIQKIRNKNSRNTTFWKRRTGLFNKASELSTLCGSEIAVIVFSESGKSFTFGHPSADSVIHRYAHVSDPSNPPPPRFIKSDYSRNPIYAQFACSGSRKNYENGSALLWENRITSTQSDDSRNRIYAQFACDASRKSYENDSALLWENRTKSTQSDNSRNRFNAQFACDASRRKRCEDDSKLLWENRINRLGLNELKLYAEYLQNLRDFVTAKATSMADQKEVVATATAADHVPNHGNQSTSNDFLVQENSFDDVKWEDIERAMADSTPNVVVGESQVSDCLEWNEDMVSYDHMLFGQGTMAPSIIDDLLLPSSQSVDYSLCDVQWEEDDTDLLASFLQMS